jgi:hypothetical protein
MSKTLRTIRGVGSVLFSLLTSQSCYVVMQIIATRLFTVPNPVLFKLFMLHPVAKL